MSAIVHNDRLTQYRAQNGLCWLCGEAIDLFQPIHSYGAASWEHVIPRCCGGSDRSTNLVLTHYECNQARANKFLWKLSRPTTVGGNSLGGRYGEESKIAARLNKQFQHQVIPHLINVLRTAT